MFQLIIFILIIALLTGAIFWLSCLLFASILGAPTVYANEQAMRDAFKLAMLKKGELVVDLGCGDARSLIIAAKEFGARGVGVERSPYAYLAAKLNVWRSGEAKRIKIRFGDFNKVESELKSADVVYLYLLNQVLANMESWLFENIAIGTRVVSLAFSFAYHGPQKTVQTKNLGRTTTIKLYIDTTSR